MLYPDDLNLDSGGHWVILMMVACHAQDLEAAQKVGFRTACMNRPMEYGPGVPPEDKRVPFDYDADNFIELAKLLKDDRSKGLV